VPVLHGSGARGGLSAVGTGAPAGAAIRCNRRNGTTGTSSQFAAATRLPRFRPLVGGNAKARIRACDALIPPPQSSNCPHTASRLNNDPTRRPRKVGVDTATTNRTRLKPTHR
jgi:hypothetical protein